jgi:hypothetical protein
MKIIATGARFIRAGGFNGHKKSISMRAAGQRGLMNSPPCVCRILRRNIEAREAREACDALQWRDGKSGDRCKILALKRHATPLRFFGSGFYV